ncbi:hypothetical protein J5571_07485 [Streptococcus suis]|uniref:macro domain-containing protein n=1 Tax=Streptococcus suis TaxID=1307 RepID=UPI0003FDB94E|nr:macro domain-containing protein [Streptococcus suis]MBL6504091.1 hypothetical protein [Streptococcus suis]MBM0242157.1 hypothetical protein [Streptococcus suis]MBM7204935.1 hypothetical protein [Streptococcus suis]MBM7281916.1 hypothetical protein [Streptococcus suis]MBO4116373.1 hypothetical protein [Streptococcus suis]
MKETIKNFFKSWLLPIGSVFGYFQFLSSVFQDDFLKFQGVVIVLSIVGVTIYNLGNNQYSYRNPEKSKLILEIKHGDIFSEKYDTSVRVIPVDEDITQNCEGKMRITSIQYQFMSKKLREARIELDSVRNNGNRITGDDKYLFLKIAKFNHRNHIELSNYKEYFEMIYELCKEMDNKTGNKEFVCPVIGGSIRFKEGNLSSMQRLQLLKLAIESYDFKQEIKITVVVKRDGLKYNLRAL